VRTRLGGRDAVREDVFSEPDRAGRRLVDARQDLNQRALAGAVLAEQRDDFSPVHTQVDAAKGPGAPEAALKPFDGEDVLLGRPRRLGYCSRARCYFTPQSFNQAALKLYEFAIEGPLRE
jgi:hypothetical protein